MPTNNFIIAIVIIIIIIISFCLEFVTCNCSYVFVSIITKDPKLNTHLNYS